MVIIVCKKEMPEDEPDDSRRWR